MSTWHLAIDDAEGTHVTMAVSCSGGSAELGRQLAEVVRCGIEDGLARRGREDSDGDR